jgi:hypothetical protein
MLKQIDTVTLSGLKLDIPDMHSSLMATIRRRMQEKPPSSKQPSAILPHIIVRNATVQASVANGDITARLAGEMQPGGTARIELLSSTVVIPNVAPLVLSGQAVFDGQRINADISAKPVDKDGQIDLHAIFDIESNRATFKVAPVIFAKAGLQPSDLVPTLMNLSTVVGKFSVAGNMILGPENPAVIVNLNINKAGFQKGDLSIEQGAAKVRIEYEDGKSSLKVGFQNGKAMIKAGGQTINLKGLQAQALLDLETLNLDATLKKAQFGHPSIAPVTFHANVKKKNNRVDFEVRGDNRRFFVIGRHDVTRNQGRAKLHLGPLHFVPGQFQPKDLSPLLTIVTEARGGIGTQAELHWSHGKVDGQAKIAFDALTLTTDTLAIKGLNGTIILDHLSPPSMNSVQTLVAQRIGGVVGLKSPRLKFKINEDKLFISHAEGEIAGGKISLKDQFIDAQKSHHSIKLAFSNLDLARLFGMMNIEGVSGKGRLNGMVPIGISADMVSINGGNFKSIDSGVLRLRSEAARDALSGAGQDAALLLDVLDDFHYQTLSFDIDKEGRGEAVVKLSTAGSNPSVMDNQPFVLNINLSTNLDKTLAVLGTAISLSQKVLRDTVKPFQ